MDIFRAIKKREKVIREFVLSYAKAYFEERDLDKLIKFIDKNITCFGTETNEIANTKDKVCSFIERDIKQIPGKINYSLESIEIKKISFRTFIANIIANINTQIPTHKLQFRITLVIKKKILALKILHIHISVPYKTTKEDSYVLQIQEKQKEVLKKIIKKKTKKLNETLNKLKKIDEIKNTIFAIISHDIRTPIATSLTLLDFIENGDIEILQNKEIVNSIKTSFKNVLQLLENLIIWAKDQIAEKNEKEEVNITSIIEEIISLYNKDIKEKNIKIIEKFDPNTIIKTNKNVLNIVLRNVIYNSIKYSNKDGEIKINLRKFGKYTTICIKDKGIGVDQEKLKSIFKKSSKSSIGTFEEKGMGIGLFIINEILKKNNGKIKIKSKESKGTRVIILLESNNE